MTRRSRGAKPQAPSTKPQGNSRSQTSKPRRGSKYDDQFVPSFVFKETSSSNGAQKHPLDLQDRTARFGQDIVKFCKKIPGDATNDRLIGQLAGCGTSVGANYCEADEGVSKKDYRNVIGRCLKEEKETKLFLRLVAAAEPALAEEARELFREARELHLILASIYRK